MGASPMQGCELVLQRPLYSMIRRSIGQVRKPLCAFVALWLIETGDFFWSGFPGEVFLFQLPQFFLGLFVLGFELLFAGRVAEGARVGEGLLVGEDC